MVNENDSKIANILYKKMLLKNSQNQYKSDWLKCIKNILDRCGYSNVWISQGNVNPKWLSVRERPFNLKGGEGGLCFFSKEIF